MVVNKNTSEKNLFLLADLGGTSSRFAIASNDKLIAKKKIPTSKTSLNNLKSFSLKYKNNLSLVVIACAGPIERNKKNSKCKLTNADVFVDAKLLEKEFNTKVLLLNDLEAVAYFAKKYGKELLVVAPGTGLGVSIISKEGKVIATEDGNMQIDSVLSSMLRVRKNKKLEYENLLAGKNNFLLEEMKKYGRTWGQKTTAGKNDKNNKIDKNNNRIEQDKIVLLPTKTDAFSEVYKFILESFILKVFSKRMEQEIKGIVLTGGVVVGNKKFFTAWKREMEEKWAIKIAIVDDDFAAIKGALVYSKMYQKNV